MHYIHSKTDISTYVSNYLAGYAEGGELTDAEHEEIVRLIQASDHPRFGTDWEGWLDANAERITFEALGLNRSAEVSHV